MKINEVEQKQLNEGIGDWMRAGLYNTLGIGGQKGNAAANMYHFLDGFTQQYKQSVNAAKESGLPMDYNRFIDSYMGRYGWTANKKQKRAMMGLVNDPKKLAKAMYAVGMSQERNQQGNVIGKQQGVGTPMGATSKGANAQMSKQELLKALQQAQEQLKQAQSGPQLSPASQKIVGEIQRLTGQENLDDLAAITKIAMQTLYSQNKERYEALYKEITTGQKAGVSPEEQIAAKRVAKLKAAAQAADAQSAPFSKLPGEEPAPTTPDGIAARRMAKQKAAMAAINGETPKATAPAQQPAQQAEPDGRVEPTLQQEPATQPSFARPTSSAIKGAGGQELPTQPSFNPRQVPGAMNTLNQQAKIAAPAAKPARKLPAKVR